MEYLVEWDGVDPKTGKPWENSWEPVQNMKAPDLVEAWEEEHAGECQREERLLSPELGIDTFQSASTRGSSFLHFHCQFSVLIFGLESSNTLSQC